MIALKNRYSSLIFILGIAIRVNSSLYNAVYTDVGRNVNLSCSTDDYSKSSWEGPCLETIGCFLNKNIYFDGLERNRLLSNTIFLQHDRHNMNGIYNLVIATLSEANEGVYTCYRFQNGVMSNTKYTVWLKEPPSNIIIRDLTAEGTIQGTEDVPLQLVCEVKSGLSDDRITMYKGFTKLKAGGSGTVTYSFIPTPQDNGQIISCVVQSASLNGSLNKKAVLDIKYRPTVHFIKENQLVIEGNVLVIKCLSESNPSVVSTVINKGGKTLKRCGMSVCSLQLRGLRNESGAYTCTASNEIGIRNSSTLVTVLYPPDVSVFLSANELHCNATGVPNNATVVSWKHYTHGGTLLRMLEGSDFYSLSSSYPRYMVDGLYICEATNGIFHTNGKTIATGNYSVKMSGLPEILQRTKRVQFGRYNDLTTIQIFVHSVPPLVETNIVKNEAFIEKNENNRRFVQTYHYIKENIFGKEVWIEGYTISLQIPSTKEEDFGNYTFVLSNEKGSTRFTAILKMKDDIDANYASNEDIAELFLSKYVIVALVGSSLVSAVITGICVFVLCTRRKMKSLEIQQHGTVDHQPQYEEIYDLNESNNAVEILNPVEESNVQDSMNEQINESVEIDLEQRQSDISVNVDTDEQVSFRSSTVEETGIDQLPSALSETREITDMASDSDDSSVNNENFNSNSQINLRASYQSLGERNSHGSRQTTGYDELVPGTFPICELETNNVATFEM